jgi:hypothetical protein
VTWWQRLLNRAEREQQLDAELRHHRDHLVADYVAAGMSEDEAQRQARLEFGGLDQVKEACRDAGGVAWIDAVTQDVRYAIRTLRATPIVTTVAVLSLALGIGANTAIFSLVNGLLLRTLPVKDPAQLMLVSTGTDLVSQAWWSYPVWDQIRQRPELFGGTLAYSPVRFNLAAGGETDFVDGIWVSGSYFDTLGVPAVLGRSLSDADDRVGGGPDGPVAVISYRFWQRHFGGAANTIGRTEPMSAECSTSWCRWATSRSSAGVKACSSGGMPTCSL